jgi:hypothetical protein
MKRPGAAKVAMRTARRIAYAEGGAPEGDAFGSDFNFETVTDINRPHKTQELTEYHPTFSDRIARLMYGDKPASPAKENFITGLMATKGLGRTGVGLIDFTPPGMVLGAQEELAHGNPEMAAATILPGAKPLGHVGKKAAGILEEGISKIAGEFQTAQQAKHANVPSVHSDDFVDSTSFKATGPQIGSNPGGVFADANGSQWYIKTPKTEDHAKNEMLAAQLYKLAGVNVPDLKFTTHNGKPGIASPIVDGARLDFFYPNNDVELRGLKENFPIDAWLANWDAVGTGMDNVIVDTTNGVAHRIDMGGALRYRAQGAPKGEAFNSNVDELRTMLDPETSWDASQVFKGADNPAVVASAIRRLESVQSKDVWDLVKKYGPDDPAEKESLYNTLLDRKNAVVDFYRQKMEPQAAHREMGDFDAALMGGNIEGIATHIYETALTDIKEASNLMRLVPDNVKQYVDQEIYNIGEVLGKHPFIDARKAADSGIEQVPFTSVMDDVAKEMAKSSSPKEVAKLIWEAAVVGDIEAAKTAKTMSGWGVSDGWISQMNKELWALKNKEKDQGEANKLAGQLFGKTKPTGKPVAQKDKMTDAEYNAHMAKLDEQTKEYYALDDFETEAVSNNAGHGAINILSSQSEVDAAFQKHAKPIEDWANWKPKEHKLSNIKFPNADAKKVKELGFNPYLKFYHTSPDHDLSVLLDPKTRKGPQDEQAFFTTPQKKAAAQYSNYMYEFVARAPKAAVLDWKQFTGKAAYSADAMRKIIAAAQKDKLDLVVLENMMDYGGKQDQYLFLNTSGTLRFPEAKFDPAKLHLSHLSAGLAGAALFVYGTVEGEAKEQEQKMPPKRFAAGGSVDDVPVPRGVKLRPGLIKSGIPGRTDKIPARVPAGSYVIPADIVSGHGEGNTIAGGRALDQLFKTGPYNTDLGRGIATPKVNYGKMGAIPRPIAARRPARPPKFAEGGAEDDGIDIIVAGGEYLLPPEVAVRLGGGDISHGHDILDQFVLQSRQKIVDETSRLKGPKK